MGFESEHDKWVRGHLKELFERFKRADESRHSEGSGLGLAIARSIVELQGGSIRIDIQGDQFNVLIDFPKQER